MLEEEAQRGEYLAQSYTAVSGGALDGDGRSCIQLLLPLVVGPWIGPRPSPR